MMMSSSLEFNIAYQYVDHKGSSQIGLVSVICLSNAVITIAIRLRSDYDVGYHARLLPFDASKK